MKLKAKFTLLTLVLAAVTFALAFFVLYTSRLTISLYQYEAKIAGVRVQLKKLETFNDAVMSSGFDTAKLSDNWNEVADLTKEAFADFVQNPVRKKLGADISELLERSETLFALLVPQMTNLDELYASFSDLSFSSYAKMILASNGMLQTVIRLMEIQDDVFELQLHVTKITQAAGLFKPANQNFDVLLNEINEKIAARAVRTRIAGQLASALLAVIAVIFIFASVMLVASKIIARIRELEKLSDKLAQKDFSTQALKSGSDEVADLIEDLNKTVLLLGGFLTSVKKMSAEALSFSDEIDNSARNTDSATRQISKNIENLHSQFKMLDEAVNRSVASLNTMTDLVRELVSDNRRQFEAIQKSGTVVQNMVSAVRSITQTSGENRKKAEIMQKAVLTGNEKITVSNSSLAEITRQLDEVGEVVRIINDIAEQTNILSINAAIESAHAGKEGQGFSVVAEEIRRLAESTAENSKKISANLFSAISKMNEVNSTSAQTSSAFGEVREQSKSILESLLNITAEIESVGSWTADIDAHTRLLADSSRTINDMCEKLASQRGCVAEEMDGMKTIFSGSLGGLDGINTETVDIASRISHISGKSMESRTIINELVTKLAEFKTGEQAPESENAFGT